MKTIAGCIIRNGEGRYLLVKEKQERVRGLWNIPAGYADEGETAAQTAVRETKEEVGFAVTVSSEPPYVYENVAKQKRYVAFKVLQFTGELSTQEAEILDARWLKFAEISSLYQKGLIRDEWIFNALKQAEDENTRD